MEKKEYEKPTITIEYVETEDIIAKSGPFEGEEIQD